MFKNFKTSLKTSFSLLFGFQLVLITALGILILVLYQNQNNLARSRDTHVSSLLLAGELRQSSDDLTRLVRLYVATGNPEFEREYWAVLDIRDGKIPRPQFYNRIYWDFVSATGQKPRLNGPAISYRELIAKEGFSDAEMAKLALAQKNSDGLVKAETVAMNAMKGLFADSAGNFTIKKVPDQKLASELVNGPDYLRTKAEIMKPIDDFYVLTDERTTAAVDKYLSIANLLFWVIIVFAFFITVTFLYSYITVKRQIDQREKAEKELSEVNKTLEQKIEDRTKVLEEAEIKTKAALSEAEKSNKFMVGRELKMIELKEKIRDLEKEKGNA